MTLSQPDEGYHQDASERQGSSATPKEEEVMRTQKLTYYRRNSAGSRAYNWVRKVTKKSTPLRRMWESEKEVVECTEIIIIGEPLMAEPAMTMNPMDYANNLSDANAALTTSQVAG